MTNITIIGFGEAGRIYAQDLSQRGVKVAVWDKKFLTPEADKLHQLAHEINVLAAVVMLMSQ
ncbi:MAG: hypothetical protein QRY16_21575 [Enterobacterales bacterium endosymbiont of Blomia tropicalis]|uniref:hypothetical protein n=1 Tax=Mixta mediterraneensis TaxID=2758443 RepID=UPI0025A7EF37|nr:hypothetical protein [Mixta mediterraneensis]MDL4916252.1 hypothetical protein [Mixta mediterraneensis]